MRPNLRKKLDKLVDLLTDPEDGAAITAIAAVIRGPDSGKGMAGEQGDQPSGQHMTNYNARVARKMETGAVCRAAIYNGRRVGGQRQRSRPYVILPPKKSWDHYDKHVALAAQALELDIREEA